MRLMQWLSNLFSVVGWSMGRRSNVLHVLRPVPKGLENDTTRSRTSFSFLVEKGKHVRAAAYESRGQLVLFCPGAGGRRGGDDAEVPAVEARPVREAHRG